MRLTVSSRIAIGVMVALVTAGSSLAGQAPSISVGGLGYFSYAYQLQTDSSLAPAGHDNNFDVGRAYLNVNAKLSDGVVARITTDVDGRKAAANQLSIRLKYAYVAWTPAKSALTYKIGEIHTPWIDWEENLWDFRFQGTTPFERNGYMTSSDFGAGVDGMWKSDEVNMQAGVYDGEGYSNAPGDNRKDVEGGLSVRLAKTDMAGRTGGLRINGYAQIGKASGGGTRQRFIGNISFKSKTFTLVAEGLLSQDSLSPALPKAKGQVVSIYGVYNIPKSKVAIIGRYDSADPNTDSTVATPTLAAAAAIAVNTQSRVITGLAYTISPNFRVLADVDLLSLQNGSPSNAFDKSRQTLYFHTELKF